MIMKTKSKRIGVSLVELVVAISIIALISGLSLSAIQASRESARALTCQNSLRQLGLAAINHESAKGYYPTSGWGHRWVADRVLVPKFGQPAGWAYQSLPYLELNQLYDLPQLGGANRSDIEANIAKLLAQPVELFLCPSKPLPAMVEFSPEISLVNLAQSPKFAATTDFAVNGGPWQIPRYHSELQFDGGPHENNVRSIKSYKWVDFEESDGMAFLHYRISPRLIQGGLSNVMWVAEKYTGRDVFPVTDYRSSGRDQSLFSGDCDDIRRWTSEPPAWDYHTFGEFGNRHAFGSSHPSGLNAVLADGSTKKIDLDIDWLSYFELGKR